MYTASCRERYGHFFGSVQTNLTNATVSGEAEEPGILEAADLVHNGMASRVAIFADAPDEVEREFTHRGAPHEDSTARFVREMRALGLVGVEQIPTNVKGTPAMKALYLLAGAMNSGFTLLWWWVFQITHAVTAEYFIAR